MYWEILGVSSSLSFTASFSILFFHLYIFDRKLYLLQFLFTYCRHSVAWFAEVRSGFWTGKFCLFSVRFWRASCQPDLTISFGSSEFKRPPFNISTWLNNVNKTSTVELWWSVFVCSGWLFWLISPWLLFLTSFYEYIRRISVTNWGRRLGRSEFVRAASVTCTVCNGTVHAAFLTLLSARQGWKHRAALWARARRLRTEKTDPICFYKI